MKKVKKLITALIILALAGTVSGDIFGDYDHRPIPTCSYCHIDKGFSIGSYSGEDTCDNCHSIKDNIPSLEHAHSNTCDRCHAAPSNDEEYHNIHKGVDCTRCHGTGIIPVKPPAGITNCASCHGAIFSSGGDSIHIIHKSRLEEICSKCHGARPSYNPSGITGLQSVNLASEKTGMVEGVNKEVDKINKKVYAKVIDYKRYTLYEIFKLIFSIFH